jgi:hypothetical protein
MEVHHHSHSHGKKNWKAYFWEFLMLFFAVFLGFLAENQREHIVEHKRAEEYAKSLLTDLKNDTADLNKASFYIETANKMIDSLIEFEKIEGTSDKGGLFYYYLKLSGWGYRIDWNKATINQLIYSGNLRYFTNTQLINKISLYSTTANTISTFDEIIETARDRAATYRDAFLNSQYNLLFSSFNMDDLYYGTNRSFIDSLKNISIPLFNKDPDLRNKYENAIISIKGNRNQLLTKFFPLAIKQATEVMELLKKEYHLD